MNCLLELIIVAIYFESGVKFRRIGITMLLYKIYYGNINYKNSFVRFMSSVAIRTYASLRSPIYLLLELYLLLSLPLQKLAL